MSGTTMISYTGTIATYTVLTSGVYDIIAYGAQGGNASFGTGGLGASAAGYFDLQAGTTLEIAVGGQGSVGTKLDNFEPTTGGGGGGGGSFVLSGSGVALVVAGGGGGAGGSLFSERMPNGGPGQTGTSGQAGTAGSTVSDTIGGQGGPGGTGGMGGTGGQAQSAIGAPASFFSTPGGGGGGYSSNGTAPGEGGAGGFGVPAGLAGGAGSTDGGNGGFGGGGGGGSPSPGDDGPPGGGGGGGGGYSGGGGGGGGFDVNGGAAGGGGSFVDVASLMTPVFASGVESGNGLVEIVPVAGTAPTLVKPTLTYTVAEGQTLTGLYQSLVQNVQDTNSGAQISIASLGLTNTMGFAYLNNSGTPSLTYTADGYQPSARQPQDSFTYTATDNYGQTVTGTVAIAVTGANETTQVGTPGTDTLTAAAASTRLIGGNGDDTLTANSAKTLVFGGNGNDTVNVNAAKATVYGGTGSNAIHLGNTAQDNIVLQQGGTDSITGFNLHNGDMLDLTQVLAEAHATFTASEFNVTDNGSDATLSWVGNPSFGGGALATLTGVGPGITLQTLIADGALKT